MTVKSIVWINITFTHLHGNVDGDIPDMDIGTQLPSSPKAAPSTSPYTGAVRDKYSENRELMNCLAYLGGKVATFITHLDHKFHHRNIHGITHLDGNAHDTPRR